MDTVLKAPGIMCNGCASTIMSNLKTMDGVEKVDVDVEQKLINLSLAEDKLLDVKTKLIEIGYPPQE
jgi:copper chaperone CopZ